MNSSRMSRNILVIGFLPVLGLMVALTVIGLSSMAAIQDRMRVIANQYNKKTEIIYAMRNVVRERSLSMYAMLHMEDMFERESELVRFTNMAAHFIALRDEFTALGLTRGEERVLNRALSLIRTSQPLQVKIVSKIVDNDDPKGIQSMLVEDLPLEKKILDVFSELVALERNATRAAVAEAGHDYRLTFFFMTSLGIAAIGLGILIAWQVVRRSGIIERELFEEKERAQVTLASIGEGVITTDGESHVTYLNPVAEQLTGWKNFDANNRPLRRVYNVISEITSKPIEHPAMVGALDGRVVGMDKHAILLNRDGKEYAVEDTAAPIRDDAGGVIGAVLVFRDVTEARSLSQQLTWQASHDALTGLVNRFEFEILLNQMIASAKAQGKQHALLYLDLDQFKVVNDTCGHVAGDELLKQLASVLQRLIRDSDTLARLGGDEFGLLLEGCPIGQAERIAGAVREAVQEFRFVWQNKPFGIGVSIGLVAVNSESIDATELLSAADAACYVAKDKGRNRVWVHKPDDEEVMQRHGEMEWVSRLNEALDENHFVLYKQLIEPLRANVEEPRHFEILVRMKGDDGLVNPMAFIPAAERYGLMSAIDRLVIREAFRWLAQHQERTGDGCTVALNVSSQSLGDENFLGYVVGELAESGVNPEQIWFEITETAAIANWNRAAQYVTRLREMGCSFALDDFGSGMSSFAYLKNLPVDLIKIDGAFVRDMAHDAMDRAMVEAINQLGHVMGKRTIAEFAENDDILGQLKVLGVDYAQGYGVRPPEPLDEGG